MKKQITILLFAIAITSQIFALRKLFKGKPKKPHYIKVENKIGEKITVYVREQHHIIEAKETEKIAVIKRKKKPPFKSIREEEEEEEQQKEECLEEKIEWASDKLKNSLEGYITVYATRETTLIDYEPDKPMNVRLELEKIQSITLYPNGKYDVSLKIKNTAYTYKNQRALIISTPTQSLEWLRK
ncbi:hypothetical protein ACFLYA_01155 [Candidatus Dependentiae bacterium]